MCEKSRHAFAGAGGNFSTKIVTLTWMPLLKPYAAAKKADHINK